MAFRRPRLRLQPNVVARPSPAKQEPEPTAAAPAPTPASPTPVPSSADPAPVTVPAGPTPVTTPVKPATNPAPVTTPVKPAAAAAVSATASAAAAAEKSGKPRPQLPSRFKRLAPRLDVGRSAAAAAAEPVRADGSTAAPVRTDGSTAAPTDGAAAPATGATPETRPPPAPSPDSVPPEPPTAPDADAGVSPAPAKRPRLYSAGLPEPEPEPETEPDDPDDPASVAQAEPAPGRRQSQVKREARRPRREPKEQAPPPPQASSPPPSENGDGGDETEDGDGEGDGDSPPPPLLSDRDLFLRKRFNTPRTKNSNRELLEQISERVSDNMPIRSKMRMQDLILWNPSTEAMSNSKKPTSRRRKRRDSASSVMSCQTETGEEAADDPSGAPPPPPAPLDIPCPDPEPEPESETEDALPVPQLKVGPDGSIVIDEMSLVVQTTQQKQRDQEMSTELVNDLTGSRLSFNGYRQRRKIDEWSIKETARFYKALSTVGTDFSIMQQLFPRRTRVDLKKKFKKEERKNPHLVERAMTDNMQYDLTVFDGDVWEKAVENCKTVVQTKRHEERERRRQERQRDSEALKKEKTGRRKPLNDGKAAGSAADILESMKTPLEKTAPLRRRKTRGRENVRRPPPPAEEEEAEGVGGTALGVPLDWMAQDGSGPATLAPVTVAPAGSVVPPGATPWQPPADQAGVLQLPAGVNPQNLLIIASPSPDRPDGQVLHVYMIQSPAGQAPDVNVTVPHNQDPAAAAALPPGAVPLASVTTTTGGGGDLAPVDEVLGLPWAGQPAPQPTGAPGQDLSPAGGAAAGEPPADQPTPSQRKVSPPTAAVETERREDSTQSQDAPSAETAATAGVDGEVTIALEMISEPGDSSAQDEGTAPPGTEGDSPARQQEPDGAAERCQQELQSTPPAPERRPPPAEPASGDPAGGEVRIHPAAAGQPADPETGGRIPADS